MKYLDKYLPATIRKRVECCTTYQQWWWAFCTFIVRIVRLCFICDYQEFKIIVIWFRDKVCKLRRLNLLGVYS
jgi:hypothetical protein